MQMPAGACMQQVRVCMVWLATEEVRVTCGSDSPCQAISMESEFRGLTRTEQYPVIVQIAQQITTTGAFLLCTLHSWMMARERKFPHRRMATAGVFTSALVKPLTNDDEPTITMGVVEINHTPFFDFATVDQGPF